jgi:hypothetical protein
MRIAFLTCMLVVGLGACTQTPPNLSESLVGLASSEQSYCHVGDTDPVCERPPFRRCRYIHGPISEPDAACQWDVWPPGPVGPVVKY